MPPGLCNQKHDRPTVLSVLARGAGGGAVKDWRAIGRWLFCHLGLHYDRWQGYVVWKDGYHCEWCGVFVPRKWWWRKWEE